MMQTKKLTVSILAALGMGVAGPGIAGSGYGHPHSAVTSNSSAASITALDSSSHSFGTFAAFASSQGNMVEVDTTDSMSADESASDSNSNFYVVVAEPNLLFSDGVWYSYADGDWYALEDGAWYSMANADGSVFDGSDASLESSDAYAFSEYPFALSSDTYAFDESQLEGSIADASDSTLYHVSEAPYYEVTLYSTDGVEWYALDDGAIVAWTPIEVIDDATIFTPTALLDDSSSYTYYLM
jgi:hypothetical protein